MDRALGQKFWEALFTPEYIQVADSYKKLTET